MKLCVYRWGTSTRAGWFVGLRHAPRVRSAEDPYGIIGVDPIAHFDTWREANDFVYERLLFDSLERQMLEATC